MRVRELRDRIQAQDYRVDPQLVAAAIVERLFNPAGARTPPGAASPRPDR